MNTTYEQVFLALAVRNKLMTHEQAQECLAEYNTRIENNARRDIEAIIRAKGHLNDSQIALLQGGAKKVMGGADTTTRPAPAPPSAAPANPQEPIPGYRIAGKIGVGGTATVFLAESSRERGVKLALKIMHPSLAKDEKAYARFVREAELLVDFDHPNIVKGRQHGKMGPLYYVLMDYIDGETVQQTLDREKSLPEARALEIIQEVAKALEYMQSKGIIHRDVKPGNIMVDRHGTVRVVDLGFAQPLTAVPGGPEEEETTSGTAQYMSPEQARGQRDIDVRADIYSLGATLYHIIMGELPFSGGDSLEVMAKQVMEALNSSEIKNRRISKHMHYFIERMMSKDKTLRYANPRELIDDITTQIEGFKSLEFNPEKSSRDSTVLRMMNQEDEPEKGTTKRLQAPTTRRTQKITDITKRLRRNP